MREGTRAFWQFQGWPWALLPPLPPLLGTLLVWLFAPVDMPGWIVALGLIAVAAGFALSALGLYRIGLAQQRLAAVARDIANGRTEQRAPPFHGSTAQIAEHLNTLGRQLTHHRDHLETLVMQTTTRLRLDQERLQELNTHLRESLQSAQGTARQQSELFANLSHELRTPLTAILGFAELLRKSGLSAEQNEYVDTQDKAARGLLGMLNDLLDWSRIEAGGLSLQEERFDLADAVEDTIAMLAPLAYEKSLELVHIVYHDVPTRLLGDAQRLRQILTNLLSNAIKFTERGEVVLRVMKERESGDRIWLRCTITDSGIGLSAVQRSQLFEPYRQFSAGRSQTGSGLGLTIVKKLVELMSGEITVDSQPGHGSTFGVLLELKSDPASAPEWARLRRRRIWLLESHATAQLALAHSLEFWGMEVRAFDSAAGLRQRLEDAHAPNRPEVIIAGFKPEDLSDAAVRELATRCMDGEPPLLALLASVSPLVQAEAIDIGAARALPKSISRLRLYRELCELTRTEKPVPALAGKRLLIADNNAANLRYLVALARELGASAVEASNGREALGLWQRAPCDYALLDLRMPELDGAATIREIRAGEPAGQRARLVAMSAWLDGGERDELLEAGADEVLRKPFDESQLLRALTPGAPNADTTSAPLRLVGDPELVALLEEELPMLLAQMEEAFAVGDAVTARAAAHTLNGVAAFYHLASLKRLASEMEENLLGSAFRGLPPDTLPRLRTTIAETLRTIRSTASA